MYKKNIDDVIRRMELLNSGRAKDQIFAKILLPSKALEAYRATHRDSEVAYPRLEDRHAFWDAYTAESAENPDDSTPAAYMSEFDEGLYAGLMGAQIRYLDNPEWGWISSMNVPFAKDVDDMLKLEMDPEGSLARQFLRQLSFFAEKSKGRYGISHFILIDGCNLLIELRGATNMYYDLMDEPERIAAFFSQIRKLNCWVQDRFFETVGLYRGGTISNLCQWCPGRIVSESLDPFHMAGEDFFEQWGRDNIEKMFSHYDGGVAHLHTGLGLRLVRPACTLRGLKMLAMVDETFNRLKAWHHLDEIDRDRGDVPVVLNIPKDVFTQKMKARQLPGNMLYQVEDVADLDEANRLMELVRNYRR